MLLRVLKCDPTQMLGFLGVLVALIIRSCLHAGLQVKFEQDLELRRQEQQAAKNYKFRASPVPDVVFEPK